MEGVRNTRQQAQPATVPKAKQAGENPASRAWVEAAEWSERMLAPLGTGVEMGGGSLHRGWMVFLGNGPSSELPILGVGKPSTRELCAGAPPARFGGMGGTR